MKQLAKFFFFFFHLFNCALEMCGHINIVSALLLVKTHFMMCSSFLKINPAFTNTLDLCLFLNPADSDVLDSNHMLKGLERVSAASTDTAGPHSVIS